MEKQKDGVRERLGDTEMVTVSPCLPIYVSYLN